MKNQNTTLNTPKRRFPEFENAGAWTTAKLGDIASFSKGKGISKDAIVANGSVKCIRYGELYTAYSEIITEVFSATNLDNKDLVLSERNDVLIPSSGETQMDIARASCILHSGIALGGDMNILKTNLNGIFLSYYLSSAKKMEIAKIAQGVSVVHLYASQLQNLRITYPTHENEQQKIATCLSSIDEWIAAQTEQVTALQCHKKGLLQQLFPAAGETVPQLRFPEFEEAGEWEYKTLGQLFRIGNGKDYRHLSDGDIPVYGSGGLYAFKE